MAIAETDSGGNVVAKIRLLVEPEDMSREEQDTANDLMLMALAEAGHPTKSFWEGYRYVLVPPVPEDVLHKARQLVCDRLGLPYEVVMVDENEVWR